MASDDDHNSIHVELFDNETGDRLGESDMALDQLPVSFEGSTTLQLGEENWTIVRAEPMTAVEFRRSGKLRLFLQRIVVNTSTNPDEILYSLATISDPLPEISPGSSKLNCETLELHEDDWRQAEFTCAEVQPIVDEDMEAIRAIYERHFDGNGFKELHVRSKLREPLAAAQISMDELRKVFDRAVWLDGISLMGMAGTIVNGFAIRLLCSVELYGTQSNGIVECLCIQNRRANNVPDTELRALLHLAETHHLSLIDWRRVQRVPTQSVRFLDYFKRL